MKCMWFIGAVFACGCALAVEIPDLCVRALRRALDSRAAWTMERRFAGSVRTLSTTGTVECVIGNRIEWKVLHPFVSSVSMTTNAMVFLDEDGERVKNLDDLPYYREIRKRTDSFARGNADAFDGLFEMNVDIRPDGAWSLEMKPENRAMRRLFSSATLEGNAKLESAVFKTKDGGISVIRFKELPRVR